MVFVSAIGHHPRGNPILHLQFTLGEELSARLISKVVRVRLRFPCCSSSLLPVSLGVGASTVTSRASPQPALLRAILRRVTRPYERSVLCRPILL